MNDTDLAYIAGFVDGEGYIGITKASRTNEPYGFTTYCLKVIVTNTNNEILILLKDNFNGNIYPVTVHEIHKPIYKWFVNAGQALQFIKSIYPYLRIKKPQADIAIEYSENITFRPSFRTSKSELELRESYYQKMKILNQRGRKLKEVLDEMKGI